MALTEFIEFSELRINPKVFMVTSDTLHVTIAIIILDVMVKKEISITISGMVSLHLGNWQ